MAPLALFDGIGLSEMLLVAFLMIVVYGGSLPDVMRNLGRAYAKFRRGLSEMSRPLREEVERATRLPEDEPTPPAWTPPPPLGPGATPDAGVPGVAYDRPAAPGGSPDGDVAAAAPSARVGSAPDAGGWGGPWPSPSTAPEPPPGPPAAPLMRRAPPTEDPFDEPPPV